MRLALDEDVSHRLARALRARGHDAGSATELGRLRLTDPRVLLRAIGAGQTLVTHNGEDFEALHEAWVGWRRRWEREVADAVGREVAFSGHFGIPVLPHLPLPTLLQLIEALAATGEPVADRLFSWIPGAGWTEITS